MVTVLLRIVTPFHSLFILLFGFFLWRKSEY
jgi:hypothetical protein